MKNSKSECRNPKKKQLLHLFRISCFDFRIFLPIGLRASSTLFASAQLFPDESAIDYEIGIA